MDKPVDTAAVAHLKATQGLGSIDIPSAYHFNWLDNARAKFDLNRRPRCELAKLIDAAWTFQRRPRRSPEGLVSGLRGDPREGGSLANSEAVRLPQGFGRNTRVGSLEQELTLGSFLRVFPPGLARAGELQTSLDGITSSDDTNV
jgi:hypothetical protein